MIQIFSSCGCIAKRWIFECVREVITTWLMLSALCDLILLPLSMAIIEIQLEECLNANRMNSKIRCVTSDLCLDLMTSSSIFFELNTALERTKQHQLAALHAAPQQLNHC